MDTGNRDLDAELERLDREWQKAVDAGDEEERLLVERKMAEIVVTMDLVESENGQ